MRRYIISLYGSSPFEAVIEFHWNNMYSWQKQPVLIRLCLNLTLVGTIKVYNNVALQICMNYADNCMHISILKSIFDIVP